MPLGQRVAVHHGTFRVGGTLGYLAGAAVLSGIVWVVQAGWGALRGVSDEDPVAYGPAVAVAFVLGAAYFARAFARWRQAVEVYENGFVWFRWRGHTIRDRGDICSTQLVHDLKTGTPHVMVCLHTAAGCETAELDLAALDRPEQLNSLIGALTHDRAAPAGPTGWIPPGWTP